MSFRISGLPAETFASLFDSSEEELATKGAVLQVVDQKPGFPCRVSLADAEVGETVILLNFEHLPVHSPYRASHAIYVRQGVETANLAIGEVPEVLRLRLLSVRAFDEGGMMIDADVVHGRDLEPVLVQMLGRSEVAYIHLHNAKPGCYAARIDRAEVAEPQHF
jgi:hypothetical protein